MQRNEIPKRRPARVAFLLTTGLTLTACAGGGGGTGNRPQVSGFDPLASNTGAVVTTVVQVQFDRDMDPGTINAATFTLIGQGGGIPAAVTYDAATRTAVLAPAADLPSGDGLYVTFDSQATDLSPLDANGLINDVFRGYRDAF